MSGAAGTADLRPIWLCADDYGMSPAVSKGIRDLVVKGRLNATSVMVVAPSLDRSEVASLKMLNAGTKRVAIGLHVTLSAPFAPLSAGFKPVRRGAFLPLPQMAARGILRLLNRDRLGIEIATQLKAFVTLFGSAPDFIDGHQHVHLFPQIREALLDVVKEAAPQAWVRQCGRVEAQRRRSRDRKAQVLDFFSRKFQALAAARGIRTNPAFAGTYDFMTAGGDDFATLFPGFLRELPPYSCVMCHPGFVDAELERLDPLTAQREREFAYFAGDDFPAALRRQGLVLA
jgi:predicted glycoside hydrolase/deacetylase ChbG (UPF0249 family)